MAKKHFFKLGVIASVFSDHQSGLKVTKNIPGSTEKPETKLTKEAKGNGHIVEITETQFWEMLNAPKVSPEEKDLALKEQGIDPKDEGIEEEAAGGSGDEDTERSALLAQLRELNLPKSKYKEIKAQSTAEIKAFVENNSK